MGRGQPLDPCFTLWLLLLPTSVPEKRVPASGRRALLFRYTLRSERAVGTVTFSQQEQGDWSVGVNLRKLIAGTQELYLVNNSLRSRKSAYEDEMSFITHRLGWEQLPSLFNSLSAAKKGGYRWCGINPPP